MLDTGYWMPQTGDPILDENAERLFFVIFSPSYLLSFPPSAFRLPFISHCGL